MKKLKKIASIILLAFFSLYTGCAARSIIIRREIGACLAEKTSRLLSGRAFREMILERWQGEGLTLARCRDKKSGTEYLVFIPDSFPTLEFHASPPDNKGEFFLESCAFLCTSPEGWNQFTWAVSGTGSFNITDAAGDGAVFRLQAAPERLGMREEDAALRRRDTRLAGQEARSVLRDREERIAALVRWMHTLPAARLVTAPVEIGWTAFLFPERVPKDWRPSGWKRKKTAWVWGEELRWDRRYTEAVFPPDLWEARNSGALWRDWEEGAAWILLEYRWEALAAEALTREICLERVK